MALRGDTAPVHFLATEGSGKEPQTSTEESMLYQFTGWNIVQPLKKILTTRNVLIHCQVKKKRRKKEKRKEKKAYRKV